MSPLSLRERARVRVLMQCFTPPSTFASPPVVLERWINQSFHERTAKQRSEEIRVVTQTWGMYMVIPFFKVERGAKGRRLEVYEKTETLSKAV